MHQHNSNKGPNPEKLVEAINGLTPAVVSAVSTSVIPANAGIVYRNWAETIITLHGDPFSKLELTSGVLVIEARDLMQRTKSESLKKHCIHAERFEAHAKSTPYYKPGYSETVIRVYELTAKSLLKEDRVREAIEYLTLALHHLEQIEQENPDYSADSSLRTSLEKTLHYAKNPKS